MIDAAQVRHIARLSRLKLSDEEIRLFSKQLAEILAYMRQLERVETEGVEPMAHPFPLTNVLRDDQPHETFTAEQALANAPERAGDFFKVPKIL